MRACRRRICGLGLSIVCAIFANASAAQATLPHITEPRSAAVGFAITAWLANTEALGKRCPAVHSTAGPESLAALKAWQDRNMPYVNVAIEYLAAIEDYIQETQGDAAWQKFHEDSKAESFSAARKTELAFFPDRKVNDTGCLHMASLVADGSLDLSREDEFSRYFRP